MAKIHYKAIEINNTIAFVPANYNDRFIMYWCWWWPGKIPFVLQQLIRNYWVEEWKLIYEKFNQSLVEISNKQLENWKDIAVLVKYIKDANHQTRKQNSTQ